MLGSGRVADHRHDRLSGHIDVGSGRIGHSFSVVGDYNSYSRVTPDYAHEIQANSSLSGFPRGLIRAAAVLGPDRAARLLGQWADGEPRQYKICVVLAGVYTDEDIELDESLRAYRLPVSSDLLPIAMPDMRHHSVARILGHTLLEMDASTHPALFIPPQGDDGYTPIPLHTHTALGDVSLDTFFLALSLVCNRQFGLAWSWNDHGDEESFTATGARSNLGGPGMATEVISMSWSYGSTGVTKLSSFDPPAPNLSESGLRRAWELRTELQRRMDSDQRFQIVVTRWARAASPGVMHPDRVIDLRIAREALYLDSVGGELGYVCPSLALSTYGPSWMTAKRYASPWPISTDSLQESSTGDPSTEALMSGQSHLRSTMVLIGTKTTR